jgi:VanZ family protein
MRWLRYWGPAAIWAFVISYASTGNFSSEKTAGHIIPFLHWLMPHASWATIGEIHHLIRKGGHVFEYFVFAMLLFYAIRAGRRGWRGSWVWITLLGVACYAGLDEFHQSFVPGRGASVWDALLDASAGTLAILIAWVWWRRRERKAPPAPADRNYAARSR